MSEISIDEMLNELEEAASLEGTELGEQWASLVDAQTAARYGSEEFEAAWKAEVRAAHKNLHDIFEIKEESVTRTITRRVLVERDCE